MAALQQHTLSRYELDARRIAAEYSRYNSAHQVDWPDVLQTSGFLSWLHEKFAPTRGRSSLRRYRAALIAICQRELIGVPEALSRLSTGRAPARPAAKTRKQQRAHVAAPQPLTRDEWAVLETAIRAWHFAGRSPWGEYAADLLGLALRTGILPAEWTRASLRLSTDKRVLVVARADSSGRERQFYVDKLDSQTIAAAEQIIRLATSLDPENWHLAIDRVRWHVRGAVRRLWPSMRRCASLHSARRQFCLDLRAGGWEIDAIARAVGLSRRTAGALCRQSLAKTEVSEPAPVIGIELADPLTSSPNPTLPTVD